MNIFKNDSDLLAFITIVISGALVFHSLGILIDIPPDLFRSEDGHGLIYDYQVLLTGIFALIAATAVWANTFIQEKLKRNRARNLVTQYIEYHYYLSIQNLDRVKNKLNASSLKMACDEIGSIKTLPQFLDNLEYLSNNQQRQCFHFINVIETFSQSQNLVSLEVEDAREVFINHLEMMALVTRTYLEKENVDIEYLDFIEKIFNGKSEENAVS